MDGDIHVLHSFTPVHGLGDSIINWQKFWDGMERLDESGLRVLNLLSLKPTVINQMQVRHRTLACGGLTARQAPRGVPKGDDPGGETHSTAVSPILPSLAAG
jgi:hypothetical protein